MNKIRVDLVNNSFATFEFTEKDFGFGQFRFYYKEDGTLMLDNEAMSKERIKEYLCVLVDQAQLEIGPPEHVTDGSPCWCNPEIEDYSEPV